MSRYVNVRYRLAEGVTPVYLSQFIYGLYGSSNPWADQIEALLPRVSCPPQNQWMQTRMTKQQARNIAEYVALHGFEGLVDYFEVMWPTEIVDGEEVPATYDPITWTEPLEIDGVPIMQDVYDSEGNITGQEQVMVMKRVGDIK